VFWFSEAIGITSTYKLDAPLIAFKNKNAANSDDYIILTKAFSTVLE
jgi:hypothetical protein